jgi:hypothetical protein
LECGDPGAYVGAFAEHAAIPLRAPGRWWCAFYTGRFRQRSKEEKRLVCC